MSIIHTKLNKGNNQKLNSMKSKLLNSNMELVKFNFNLPKHIHYKLKIKCYEEGKLMTNVVREMIVDYLRKK